MLLPPAFRQILKKIEEQLIIMKLRQIGFLCITLLLFISHAMAQDFDFLAPSREIIEPVFDNRSIAMGNTAVTTPSGSSAIFSNPAILATFSKPQVQVGGKLLYGTITNEAVNENELYESYEARYAPFPSRSYLAFAMPYRLPNTELKLAFGIGYQRNEGAKWEAEAVWLEEEWSAEEGELVDIRVTSNNTSRTWGHLSTLTPGVALNLQDRYFFGLALNRTFGAIISTSEGKRLDQQTKIDLDQEQSATFLRIGALAKVTRALSVGLTYRRGFGWELGEIITKTYEDGKLETDREQSFAELTIPPMWGLGAEYKGSPEWVAIIEVQSRPFSELRWARGTGRQLFVDNGFNVAVGAEYLGTAAPFRFGAFRDVLPFVDENDAAPLSLLGLTAGIGSDREADFSWDASVLFGTWEQVNNKGQKYSENLMRVGISVMYRFSTSFGAAATN